MSLNADERARTSAELTDNYTRSRLTPADIHRDLGLDPEGLTAVLAMDPGVDPRTVWALRDHLVTAVLATGARPRPYTALTDDARAAAHSWFGIASTGPQQT